MRILYLHQYFNTPSMAGGTRSFEMARRLVTSGHKVIMVTTDRNDFNKNRGWRVSEEAGIEVHWIPTEYSNEMSYPKRIRAFFRFVWHASLHCLSIPADVVFATSTPLTIAIPGIIAKKWHRIPLVFEVRDLWPDLPIAVGVLRNPLLKILARTLERLAYRASSHIIALSPGMAQGVIRQGIAPKKTTIIPNSCDIELFNVSEECGNQLKKKLGMSSQQALIVYAGAFGYINGVSYIVKLAKEMLDISPEVRFLLVGRGAEFDQTKKLAHELGVMNRNLWIWESVCKSEMPILLSAATVTMSVVVPLRPLWNNSANKFFDSLAAGKPIALNYEGWQADLLRRTGAGSVLAPHGYIEAAEQLAEFINDPRSIEEAGRAARRLARDSFDRNKLASDFEQILVSAFKGNKKGKRL